MMMMKEKKRVPMLRFEGFEGEWEKRKFSKYIKLYRGSSPRPIHKYQTNSEDGVNWIKIGDTKDVQNYTLKHVSEKITKEGAKKSRPVKKGELILANSMSFGKTYLLDIEGCIYDGWFVLREYEEHFKRSFLLQLLNSEFLQRQYKRLSTGGVVQNISSDIVYSTILSKPELKEQQKIATFLTSIDTRIQQLEKKRTLLEQYKKGVMQQLFKQEVRFKDQDGEEFPKWEKKGLGEMLDYEQPTKFIVKSTEYEDSFPTPVLTAGKSFILGYTDETNNIYTDFPVIIFDDFTMATQFVDFPFKVKSSAMKILKPSCSKFNIKFLFESIQMIRYPKGDEHKRFWISEYSKIKIVVPCIEEQTKIAHFLTSLDNKITVVDEQIERTKEWKKGLLQRMFV